ncbi:hypothetical protein [Roseateles microcysteis]|uniref:hypothetical protein n=1 Tax=Roseateles microcysteis TaxID=3119057 RepID=UPI002FE67B59
MNTTPYKLILAHGLQQRSNDKGWRTLAIVAAMVLVPAVVLMIWGSAKVAGVIGGNLIMTVAAVYWGALVVNLLEQNHPNAARLVPGHVPRLRQVLIAGWLLSSLPMAVGASVMGLPALPAWIVSAWGMAALGLLMRWPLGWTLLSVVPFLAVWLYRNGLFAQAAELLQSRPALCVLVSLVLPPLPLLQVLGEGNGAHRKAYARSERWRDMARQGDGAQTWDSSKLPAPLSWITTLVQSPYRRELRRLSSRTDAASVGARLMLGLGPATHWTAQLSGCIIFGTIFGLVCLGSLWIPIGFVDFLRAGSFGLTIGLMSALLGPLTGIARTLDKTRNEQRLLVLLPGMPRGQALNRLLARQWLAQFGLTWLLGLAVATVVMGFSGAPAEMLLPFLLAYLLPIALVWRDWARQASKGHGPVLLVFGVISSALLGYVLYRWAGVPIWIYGSLQALLTLVLGITRWRKQVSAPQALPVGRLA